VLAKANRSSLNVEGAYQHILTDLYGFIGTAIAAIVILTTGYTRADSIASLVVVALMLKAARGLLRDSGRVLLEAAPDDIDLDDIRTHLLEGVRRRIGRLRGLGGLVPGDLGGVLGPRGQFLQPRRLAELPFGFDNSALFSQLDQVRPHRDTRSSSVDVRAGCANGARSHRPTPSQRVTNIDVATCAVFRRERMGHH